jgi:hypothetical protein
MLLRFEQRAHLVLTRPRPDSSLHRSPQSDCLHWALQQGDIAQRFDQVMAPRTDARAQHLAGEDDEGQIRPGRLVRHLL